MKLIMIRHGEPTYESVRARNFIGSSVNFGELTPDGIKQAELVSHDERLIGAELIVSSPYTRALHTAAIISKNTGLNISTEIDLREWSPDLTQKVSTKKETSASFKECLAHNGVRTPDCIYNWESAESVGIRAFQCLKKYINYNKIIVVAHAMLIRQFGYFQKDFPYCGIYEVEFDENSVWNGFKIELAQLNDVKM